MKKKYTFEFIQEQNVETEVIKAADHLICWVEEENARIIDEESEAYVVIAKRDRKGNILYAQSLEFPMDSETDFDGLLEKFYTRKPIKFDQSILEESDQAFNQDIPAPVIPKVAAPPTPAKQDAPSESYAAVPPMPVTETNVAEPSQQSKEIQELIEAQRAQQEEIQKLKQQLEEERKAVASATETKIEPVAAPSKEGSAKPHKKLSSVSIGVPGVGATKTLSSFETAAIDTDLNFQDRIDLFVEQEKQKIETEIFAADRRDLIETEIMAKIKEEKENTLGQLEMDLYEKQAAAIEKEEKRHAAEMKRINQEYESQIEEKSKKIEDKFKRKAAAEMRAEYNRQTKELKRIFDERMIELKKRQSELSSKLMENIKSTFSSLDLTIDEPAKEQEQEKPPVLAELKTIRAGE